MVAGPGDSLVEVGQLALFVWLARADIPGPVADGDADVVETVDGQRDYRNA